MVPKSNKIGLKNIVICFGYSLRLPGKVAGYALNKFEELSWKSLTWVIGMKICVKTIGFWKYVPCFAHH